MSPSSEFGTAPIGKLLRQQSIPASVGILILSIYGIVDTIFVGRWVGTLAIAAISVVMPISFFIASIGMSIGVGGASIISRSLGAGNQSRAYRTFGNMMGMTFTLALLFVAAGFAFETQILNAFGAKGDILEPATDYFEILLVGIPFLSWAMMSNNVIRAEGYPRIAMGILIIPAIANLILDPIFIVGLGYGIKGAAWATTLAYIASAVYATRFFTSGRSRMQLNLKSLYPDWSIVREVVSLGSITLARQGTISMLSLVLNNSLFAYGGELAVSVYGVISRVMMFANFPVVGITQGTLPILGYNYGAKLWQRVNDTLMLAIKSVTLIAGGIFLLIMLFSPYIVQVFTTDQQLIAQTSGALRWVFLATPLIGFNLLGSGYFQSIGRALPALLLALTKQGFFLIPLILLLPLFFGIQGVWFAFPIADLGAAALTWFYLKRELPREMFKHR